MDWLNNVYPEEDVIKYNKVELIKQENRATLEYLLGMEITITEKTVNAKLGAMIITDENLSLWIEDMDSWPMGFYNGRDSCKIVEATGILIEKYDLPVFIHKEGEPTKSGMPVPEGTNLKEASHRYLLKDIKWEIIED